EMFFESTGICLSPSGDVWVSTSNGLLKKYIPDENRFLSFDVFELLRPGANRWIEKIQATTEGAILIGTGTAGAKVFDPSSGTYKNIPLLQKGQTELFVRNFLQSSTNEWWIGTESGIFIYNTVTGLTTNLQKKYNDPYSLSDNAVYTFCRDKEGGIWAGTYFGGINYYPQPLTPFTRMIPKSGENSLSGNVVREITKDHSGNLWIGTEDAGLNKWDASAKKFVHFQPTGLPTDISYTNIHGLLLTGDELWIGTFEHGLDVMNIKTGKVVRRFNTINQPALKSNFIHCLYETKEGEILIGTTIAIYRYNRSADRIEPLPGLPVYNWYTGIIKDSAGTIWTTTFGNGINYLDTKTGKSGNLRYHAADKYSISSDRVNALFEDSEKNLWFATENGLCKWNAALRNFKRYSTAEGLPSNFIMSILEDNAKQLWVSTTKGLVAFQPNTGKMQVYTIANGLLSDQFNFSSAYKDADGRMYFGSAKGLVSFHPSEFKTSPFKPPVYITGFQIDNKDIVIAPAGSPLKNAITFTKSITLKHDQ
ncbi:MAG TPA: two-component regulator propeller domain-containing protein, partial [Flavisolibacter sp.]